MKKSVKLKKNILSITVVFPLVACLLFTILITFEVIRVRRFMVNVALSLPVLLDDDFQDRAIGPDSITYEEELRNRRLFNGIRDQFNLNWVYTLVEEGGRFYFTSPTVTEEEAAERDRWYYYPYEDIPDHFVRAFKENRKTFAFYRDTWGCSFSLILPLTSPAGRPYLACVDITPGQLFQLAFFNKIVEFLLFIVFSVIVESYVILLKKRNGELAVTRHEAFSHRRELERVLYERTQESKIKAEKYARLNMRLVAALEASNLTLVLLNLEDMTIIQETNFTFEGESPERIDQPVKLEDFFLEFIHPNGHHLIKDALHEFQNEEINEKTLELRLFHEGRWLWFRFYCRRNTADSRELLILGQMIHQEKVKSEELYRKANYDALTRMVNRHYCYSYLDDALEQKRKRDFPMTVAFVDADSLKQVNDILGHKQGDMYLLDIVDIIKKGIREDDILGRIGGDEFLLICPQTSLDDFMFMADRIESEIVRFNRESARAYKISFSMGYLEVGGSDDMTVDELLEEADTRMYEVKAKKKRRGEGISVLPS